MKPAATPPSLVTLVLITAISVISMNVFLPSLSGMATHFDADYGLIQLSISGYLAVTGVLQLVIGPLSDRYGRRPILLVGFAVFLLATLGCLQADGIYEFLFFRGLQGSVAAGMVMSRAIVRDLHPPDKAASVIGYVTMAMALAPMVAPLVGGFLDEFFGWKASFVLLFFAGLGVFVLVWVDLGETNKNRSGSMLNQFRSYPELFRSRRFWGYSLSATFAAGAFFSFLGGAPFVAERIFGLGPAELGVYMGMIPAGYMLGNFLSGRYTERVGLTVMMLRGTIVSVLGLIVGLVMVVYASPGPYIVFGAVFFVGLGNGLTMPSANAGALSVRPHLAGSAAGLAGALVIGGGAALSAITGAILTEQSGAQTLILMMLASSIVSFIIALYVRRIDLKEGALGAVT